MSQLTLLLALSAWGETTQARMAKLLLLDSTTLSRTLGRLRERGWIARGAGKDNREHKWELTDAGRQQLEVAMPHWERVQGRLTAALETAGDSMRQIDALAETALAVRRKQE